MRLKYLSLHEIEAHILQSGGHPQLPEEAELGKQVAHFRAPIQNSLYVSLVSRLKFEAAVSESKIPESAVRPNRYDTSVKRSRRAVQEQDDKALFQCSGILPYLGITAAKHSFKNVLTAQ